MLPYSMTIGTGFIWNLVLLICILLFFRKICRIVLFLLIPVFFMGALLYAVLLVLPDFNVPVDEKTARVAARGWLDARGIEGDISSVIVRKGADAGDIGYYVLKIGKPYNGFLIVPADARFGSDTFFLGKSKESYIDYYAWCFPRYYVSRNLQFAPSAFNRHYPPKFQNTIRLKVFTLFLKLKSLASKILFRKSDEQRAWRDVLGGE